MKKKNEFTKISNVLSTAAILAIFAVPSFAQEVEFNKDMYDSTPKLEDIIVKKKIKAITAITPKGISKMKADIKADIDIEALKQKLKEQSQKEVELAELDDNSAQDVEFNKTQDSSTPKLEDIVVKKQDKVKVIHIDEGEAKDVEFNKMGESLTPKLEDLIKRKEVKTVSTLTPKGIKEIVIEGKETELESGTPPKGAEQETATAEASASQKEDLEEGVIDRDESLMNYICQKEEQLAKLEEKLATFQTSITESTLAMQQAISQIAMMNTNRYQIQRAPSVFDRFDHMYPMMMMQQMQNQQYMQNLNYNYTQSMNTLLMSASMSNYNNYGQRENAYTNGQSNLANNYIPGYNLERLNLDQQANMRMNSGHDLHWNNQPLNTQFDLSGQNIKVPDAADATAPVTNEVAPSDGLDS